MKLVVRVPDPAVEDIDIRLARVPVAGDFIEFAEDHPDDRLRGELFLIDSVCFPVDGGVWPEAPSQPPVVRLAAT